MAFGINYMGRVSTSANNDTQKVWIYNGTSTGSNETVATIAASGYFNAFMVNVALGKGPLSVGDLIVINGNDASAFYTVQTVTPNVTVSVFAASGVVGTANIQDGAVTANKLATDSVTTVKILDDNVTSDKLAATVLKYVAVPLTAANIIAMNGAPVQVLAAGGANTVHLVEHACLMMTYGTVQFTGGGAIGLQYGNTAALAGEAASSTIAAANIQGAASTMDMVEGALSSGAFTAVANLGLFISNLTAAFADGDSNFVLHLWYRTVPTV
ncbi:TPA: hypothetical protein VAH77_000464 [Legionella pneumophila]|nr:hypothetical protein [Legionella pneumophila]